jgi:predicted small lipoprotein YifL
MIKKIFLTFLICCLLTSSCGKKGPPSYEDPDQKVEMIIILNNKA